MPQVTIGILALQGAFFEHQTMLQKIAIKKRTLVVLQVRLPKDLQLCDALIIPGGESTTIALLARLAGLLEPLREFLKIKPVWGSCAGAILMSRAVENAKKGGQELLGGVSVTTSRNGWGSQVESFEVPLRVEHLREPEQTFRGVFIRAPVVLSLCPTPIDPPIKVISRISVDLLPPSRQLAVQFNGAGDGHDDPRTIVALSQGNHLLTTFHPELTKDSRFHEYFVQKCVVPTLVQT